MKSQIFIYIYIYDIYSPTDTEIQRHRHTDTDTQRETLFFLNTNPQHTYIHRLDLTCRFPIYSPAAGEPSRNHMSRLLSILLPQCETLFPLIGNPPVPL